MRDFDVGKAGRLLDDRGHSDVAEASKRASFPATSIP